MRPFLHFPHHPHRSTEGPFARIRSTSVSNTIPEVYKGKSEGQDNPQNHWDESKPKSVFEGLVQGGFQIRTKILISCSPFGDTTFVCPSRKEEFDKRPTDVGGEEDARAPSAFK